MNDQIENLVTPLQELNALAVSNIEKLTKLNLKSIEQSASASIEALKSTTEIKDFETLQAYISTQAKAAQAIAKNAEKNANTIAELGQSYADEAKKIAEDAFSKK
jgi:phasin family protein